jgi:hypothetical protein
MMRPVQDTASHGSSLPTGTLNLNEEGTAMPKSTFAGAPRRIPNSRARRCFRSLVVGVAAASFTLGAQSAQQWCVGTLSFLFVDAAGAVNVLPSARNDYVQLCNVNGTWGNIPTTTCLAWLSLARNALQRGSAVTIYYGDAPVCSALPTYGSAPVPNYVMMNN